MKSLESFRTIVIPVSEYENFTEMALKMNFNDIVKIDDI